MIKYEMINGAVREAYDPKNDKRYMLVRENKKDGTVERFPVKINWIEDRGDFWYVGYTPEDLTNCRFGAEKVKKAG